MHAAAGGNLPEKQRESGVELLRILAFSLIIVSHVALIYGSEPSEVLVREGYFADLGTATNDLQQLTLSTFRYFGSLGNDIFLICSSWFLCDSQRVNPKKVMQMISDNWVLAVLAFVTLSAAGQSFTAKETVKFIFPTTFAQNWFVTCYLLLYMVHPLLNILKENITQKQLLLTVVILTFLYCGVGTVAGQTFFASNIIIFIVVYLTVAYAKKYMLDMLNEKNKFNNFGFVRFLIDGNYLFY